MSWDLRLAPALVRAARDTADVAVGHHPTMVRALAEGCWWATPSEKEGAAGTYKKGVFGH
ncbi:hypothetical protein OG689_42915 [Kitasatospora sp. NBC_00240]|uniref:hypothetical protein n=1 Tax=Kitasatospora sp. NBC_00240 TaxID=2903567 RepID=UPI0022599066|nr:hypothetical protein [Kitasatospora sp. NBC_00240]MCX5215896.1 hypothetical protein [Kitasatospora sp. NBC_00240]